jgi:hypothetical protein
MKVGLVSLNNGLRHCGRSICFQGRATSLNVMRDAPPIELQAALRRGLGLPLLVLYGTGSNDRWIDQLVVYYSTLVP